MSCNLRTDSWRRKDGERFVRSELTLGAKLTILFHPFNLRSALTIPPIRVPSISRLLFSRTAALSSKRTTVPSGRRTSFRVRTMTARRTSPRLTLTAFTDAWAAAEIGLAFCTTTTISSPTEPQPLVTLFFKTLTHSARRAPELSITYKMLWLEDVYTAGWHTFKVVLRPIMVQRSNCLIPTLPKEDDLLTIRPAESHHLLQSKALQKWFIHVEEVQTTRRQVIHCRSIQEHTMRKICPMLLRGMLH